MAKAVALAAARELNGTAAGIAAARTSARTTAERFVYAYRAQVTWDDAALSFSKSPDRTGTWVPATAAGDPSKLYFAKVDTSFLSTEIGTVHTNVMPILSKDLAEVRLADVAVAGRTSVNVAPIAICAMAENATAPRTNTGLATEELVEYGFRRGVSYDLMQLNPNGTTPARYLVNPVAAPGSSGATFDPSVIGPFACTGSLWIPRLTGGAIHVSPLPSSSPLGSIYFYLNSRFDDYTDGQCSPNGAPPDFNIKSYAYDIAGGASWMTPATGNAAAATTTERNKLETIADLPAPPAGTVAGAYGPLWAYAKAAKYAPSEPNSGYASFATADWAKLYKLGPTGGGYPTASATPYKASMGVHYAAPRTANLEIATEQRRVLNVPLLACPVDAGYNVQATALGSGKFFMTVPATRHKLIAEFGGLVSEQSLSGQVELYP
jgi:hypothetical protein